jgi:Carboxypeptidase regulatory-like domain/Peptidase family M1 domain
MRYHIVSFALLPFIAGLLPAASLSVIVKDPSEGLVASALVTIQAEFLTTPRQIVTDRLGQAHFDSLRPGRYRVSIAKSGFDQFERSISLNDKTFELDAVLNLKTVTTTVQVSARRSPLANSDPNYVALRNSKLTKVYRVHNLVLKRDVGVFTFRSGSFSFLPPVLGKVVTGVFVGDGNFQLTPAYPAAVQHLHRLAGMDSVNEDFNAMVLYFGDSTFDEITRQSELADEAPDRHEAAFKPVKDILQHRREPSIARPLSPLERLLNYEDIPNYDAEMLAERSNPAQGASFRAFLHGISHSDLRFLLNPRGAMPMLPAPEEVALLYFDPGSNRDGIWYLSHLASELDAGRASSNEDKRLIAPEHYRVEAFIGKANLLNFMPELAATCELLFRSLDDGTRMLKFDMIPDLQVSRVTWNGKEIPFVQENRQKDGSFYLQMPEPLSKGRTYRIAFEYAGGEILQSQFWIPTRRVWYPTPAGTPSRATYDLTFRVQKGATIVAVGNQVRQWREGTMELTQWICDAPIPQAVFRYLEDPFRKDDTEESTNTRLSAYIDSKGPTFVLPPSISNLLKNSGNALRVFNAWFGKPAYDSLHIVVAGGSVDSVPTMVIAPPVLVQDYVSLKSQSVTMQSLQNGIRRPGVPPIAETFLDEASSALIARQWFGNTVSPASFHDEWLASGFSSFSASIYDLALQKPDDFSQHWVQARQSILSPNWNGFTVTGPLWMGLLSNTFHAPGVGQVLATSKGGYVLNMLRSMMWDPTTGDDDFRALLRDYIAEFTNRTVSTEDFQAVVEKHMKPVMDLEHNRRMDWFFREWVYETDIPSYRLEYSLTPASDRRTLLAVHLTQSGVSPHFTMPVPIFAEFAGKKMRVGMVAMSGNFTADFKVLLSEEPKRVLLNINHDVLTDREEVKRVR